MSQTNGTVTQIAFRPAPAKSNELAFADASGQMTRWVDVIPSNLPGPANSKNSATTSTRNDREAIAGGRNNEDDDEDEDMDDDDKSGNGNAWIDDDLGLDDDGRGGGYKEAGGRSKKGGDQWAGMRGDYDSTTMASGARVKGGQIAFQPGATTFTESRRYLGQYTLSELSYSMRAVTDDD